MAKKGITTSTVAESSAAPAADCPLCPRLGAFRDTLRRQHPDWHNSPVPSFGDTGVRLLVVGLAPGKHGANRTGRPFTGDYAGDLLFETLIAGGFAEGAYDARPDDGLRLVDCRITNAVRCLPPGNKPGSEEIRACNPYLAAEFDAMPRLAAILALGRIAHDAVLMAHGLVRARHPFGHGATHRLASGRVLYDSYHCSRYNTNTRRLTPAMFQAVLARIGEDLKGLQAS